MSIKNVRPGGLFSGESLVSNSCSVVTGDSDPKGLRTHSLSLYSSEGPDVSRPLFDRGPFLLKGSSIGSTPEGSPTSLDGTTGGVGDSHGRDPKTKFLGRKRCTVSRRNRKRSTVELAQSSIRTCSYLPRDPILDVTVVGSPVEMEGVSR